MTRFTLLMSLALVAPLAEAAPADWRAKINTTLDKTKISVEFDNTPMDEAFGFISQFANLNLWLDPQFAEGKWRDRLLVTLRAENLAARSLLDLLTQINGIAWDLRWGGIFVATKERMAALPRSIRTWYLKEDGESKRAKSRLEKPVNLNFDETPVQQVLGFLSSIGQVNIIFLPETADLVNDSLVSLKASDLRLRDALGAVLLPHGLAWELKDGVVMVKLLPEDPDDLWREPARRILKETRVKGAWGTPGADGGYLARSIAALDEKVPVPIVLDYVLESFEEGPVVIRDASLRGISVESILGLLTMSPNLAWDLRWEVVFVSTPERLKQFPKSALPPERDPEEWERQLRRRLKETISFDFDGAKLQDAVDFVRALIGLNLVFEPSARQAAEVLPVTLKVENVSVEHALALLLYPRTQRFELKHEVVLIRKQ